jgi:hypothetical protein
LSPAVRLHVKRRKLLRDLSIADSHGRAKLERDRRDPARDHGQAAPDPAEPGRPGDAQVFEIQQSAAEHL